MKKFILLLIVLAILLILPNFTYANQDIEIKVDAGYNGIIKEGSWGPVNITVTNKGQNLDGEISINAQNGTSYIIPLQLPQGSTKKYQIYLAHEILTSNVDVEIIKGNNVIAKTNIKLQTLGIDVPLIGYLTDVGLTLPQYQNIRDGYFIPLKISDLPETLEPYNNFNMLIISDVDTSGLSNEQKESLLLWIEKGGHVLVSGGHNWQKTYRGLPEQLKPVLITGTDILTLPEISDSMSVSYGELKKGFSTYMEIYDVPVIAETRYGNGSVIYTAFDMVDYLRKPGSQDLYMGLIQPKVVFTKDMYYRETNPMHWTLRNIPVDDFYSPSRVGLIFLLYVLILGPLNFYILKRFDKREFAWITIPVLVLIFTIGFYSLGFGNKGLRVLTNTITVTTLPQEGESGTRELYFGFFSPQGHTDRVTLNGNYLVGGLQYYHTNERDVEKVIPGDKTTIVFSQQNLWNMKTLAASTVVQNTGKIVGDIGLSTTGLNGNLKNETNFDLEDVIIKTPSGYAYIEDLPKGSSIDTSTLNFISGHWQYNFGGINPRGGSTNSQNHLRNNILSNVTNIGYTRSSLPNPINNRIEILGWIKGSQELIAMNEMKGLHVENNLIVSYLSFDYWNNDTFHIPPGFLAAKDFSTKGGYYKRHDGTFILEEGELMLTYRLPEIRKEQVKELRFYYYISDPSFLPEHLEIFNTDTDTWDEGVIINNATLSNPEKYVDSQSTIRIRITKATTNQRYQPLHIDGFNIEVRGEK